MRITTPDNTALTMELVGWALLLAMPSACAPGHRMTYDQDDVRIGD